MTQGERDLLFTDLCTRLPYGIIVQQSAQYPENHFMYSVADKWKTEPHDFKIIGIQGTNTLITDKLKEERTYAKGTVSSPITICIYDNLTKQIAKPYLRPMSSIHKDPGYIWYVNTLNIIRCCSMNVEVEKVIKYLQELQTWLISRHYDINHLIEKNLAFEAPEDMYKVS